MIKTLGKRDTSEVDCVSVNWIQNISQTLVLNFFPSMTLLMIFPFLIRVHSPYVHSVGFVSSQENSFCMPWIYCHDVKCPETCRTSLQQASENHKSPSKRSFLHREYCLPIFSETYPHLPGEKFLTHLHQIYKQHLFGLFKSVLWFQLLGLLISCSIPTIYTVKERNLTM